MLTGEYVALDGAKVLGLPTRFGQDLTVSERRGRVISWTGYEDNGAVWYQDDLHFDDIMAPIPSGKSVRNTLLGILQVAALMQPDFLKADGYAVETRLTFPRLWGLGTSSTLLNNIADWLEIDPYVLLRDSFGGSGYDIACARHNYPIFYRKTNDAPTVEPAGFDPVFADKLFFVYLNKKQSSKAAIASYYSNRYEEMERNIAKLDKITNLLSTTTSVGVFARELEHHEAILSDILEMQTVKEAFFHDFPGTVKSLGSWGGDFVLAVSKENPQEYFKARGFATIIPYRDMIL